MAVVAEDTYRALAGVSAGKLEALRPGVQSLESDPPATGLDQRTFALVRIAALIALDAPPASFAFQVEAALEVGASPEQILGVLRAVAPEVGGPRVVGAAPEIMLALGLDLPEAAE